ncbi:MAG TPA: hypothetical protein GX745_02755, partial [Clostridiales bacterium]|nr:hypothetical protein [Clostridiales bacterium]
DLHYSDFWADPSKQFKPKSWQGLDFDELQDKAYQYTKNILTTLKNNNIEPEYVQIGNEITAGMLWEEGKLIWKDGQVFGFDNLALLLKAGVKAVQDTSGSKIILHLERSGDNALYRQWFDNIIFRNVYFDIIGVSYYPYWHGTLDDMQNNLNDMIDRYKKDILVVETSYAYTLQDFDQRPDNYTGLVINKDFASKDMPYPFTPQGQAEYLRDLFLRIKNLKDKRGLGIYYWEPCWIPTPDGTWASPKAREYIKETHKGHGNEWANQALFDYNGKMNYALKIYNKF